MDTIYEFTSENYVVYEDCDEETTHGFVTAENTKADK